MAKAGLTVWLFNNGENNGLIVASAIMASIEM
jgi:hypothetical protein